MRDAPHAKTPALLELDDPTELEASAPRPAWPPAARDMLAEAPLGVADLRQGRRTITDEAALEQARLASIRSVPPMRPRAASVEILTGEEDLEQLATDEQIAILRARLAPLERVPALARSLAELGALLEDPKTAYVLGFVDGVLPLDTIIDVTGLPELDTLRVLDKVAAQGLFVYGKR